MNCHYFANSLTVTTLTQDTISIHIQFKLLTTLRQTTLYMVIDIVMCIQLCLSHTANDGSEVCG